VGLEAHFKINTTFRTGRDIYEPLPGGKNRHVTEEVNYSATINANLAKIAGFFL
jgi:hypothetical protein